MNRAEEKFPQEIERVTIIGIGLIGGSLAGAIKSKGLADRIIGVDEDEEATRQALEMKLIDDASRDWKASVEGSDLVVLSTPVGVLVEIAQKVLPYLRPGSILTDVGSVKAFFLAEVEPLLPKGVSLVGGHPIAGTERSGVTASTPTLFEGTKCVLTPTPQTSPEALKKVSRLWRKVGAEVIEMDPEAHDRALAAVSHLPHMVAYSLVNAVAELAEEDRRMFVLPGGGFRDFTRVASSHPVMWRDICLFNGENILRGIDRFQSLLDQLKACITRREGAGLEAEFARAQAFRQRMQEAQGTKGLVSVQQTPAPQESPAVGRKRLIITIDGPAASGKSTLSQLVAHELGYLPVPTGALYRAVAWKALKGGIDPADHAPLARLSANLEIRFRPGEDGSWQIYLEEENVTQELHREEIGQMASAISKIREVREALFTLQRHLGESGGVVMEGRDIGTVIFPEADIKFYLVASPEERGRRRYEELKQLGVEANCEGLIAELKKRDLDDSCRELAPLRPAEDAILIDTTHLSIEEVKERMLKVIRERWARSS